MSTAADKARQEIMARPGMKEREFEKCLICRCGVAHDNGLTFYRLTVERFILDPGAIRRTAGLQIMIGGPLASVMGPNEDIAKSLHDPKKFLVCETCAIMKTLHVADAAERLTAEDPHAPA